MSSPVVTVFNWWDFARAANKILSFSLPSRESLPSGDQEVLLRTEKWLTWHCWLTGFVGWLAWRTLTQWIQYDNTFTPLIGTPPYRKSRLALLKHIVRKQAICRRNTVPYTHACGASSWHRVRPFKKAVDCTQVRRRQHGKATQCLLRIQIVP